MNLNVNRQRHAAFRVYAQTPGQRNRAKEAQQRAKGPGAAQVWHAGALKKHSESFPNHNMASSQILRRAGSEKEIARAWLLCRGRPYR